MGNLVKETPYSEVTATLEVFEQHGITRDHLKRVRSQSDYAKRVCDIMLGSTLVVSNWLQALWMREFKRHLLFFGTDFDLAPFVQTLKRYGRKQIVEWQRLGLDVSYLPKVLMASDAAYPGWRVKPEKWLYKKSEEAKLFRLQADGKLVISNPAYQLGGITVLVDTRCKPTYDNGRQMYENDKFLGPIIEQLRSSGSIAVYSEWLRASRFNISSLEWEEHVKPAVAKLLKLKLEQVRLETATEANVIPQLCLDMPRKDDGTTNTSEWREEFFESRGRLYGGRADYGGLASIDCSDAGGRWGRRAFRSLAVL